VCSARHLCRMGRYKEKQNRTRLPNGSAGPNRTRSCIQGIAQAPACRALDLLPVIQTTDSWSQPIRRSHGVSEKPSPGNDAVPERHQSSLHVDQGPTQRSGRLT
jgi:hypothetical protein